MTPQIPDHIRKELAKRELALLTKQRDVAAESIKELSDAVALSKNGMPDYWIEQNMTATERLTLALTRLTLALTKTRLLELQLSHENLDARVKELEAAIAAVESGIVRPGGVLR